MLPIDNIFITALIKRRTPTKGSSQVLTYLIFVALVIIAQMIVPQRSLNEIKVLISEGLSYLSESLSDFSEGLSDLTESRSDYDRSNTTIITGLFLLNSSRHTDDNYFILIEKRFSNEDPMIIFTSPDLAPKLAKLRGKPNRTVVIPTELKDTKIHKKYPQEEFWRNVSHLNCERGISINSGLDPQIYWVWNSKMEFVKMGSDLNPFKSKFFVWVDAGLVRWDKYINTSILQRVPPELPENQTMFLHVTPILRFKKKAQMGGGMYLCDMYVLVQSILYYFLFTTHRLIRDLWGIQARY